MWPPPILATLTEAMSINSCIFQSGIISSSDWWHITKRRRPSAFSLIKAALRPCCVNCSHPSAHSQSQRYTRKSAKTTKKKQPSRIEGNTKLAQPVGGQVSVFGWACSGFWPGDKQILTSHGREVSLCQCNWCSDMGFFCVALFRFVSAGSRSSTASDSWMQKVKWWKEAECGGDSLWKSKKKKKNLQLRWYTKKTKCSECSYLHTKPCSQP